METAAARSSGFYYIDVGGDFCIVDRWWHLLPVAVAFFSIKIFMKMPNGAEKKRQSTDNHLRNESLENISASAAALNTYLSPLKHTPNILELFFVHNFLGDRKGWNRMGRDRRLHMERQTFPENII